MVFELSSTVLLPGLQVNIERATDRLSRLFQFRAILRPNSQLCKREAEVVLCDRDPSRVSGRLRPIERRLGEGERRFGVTARLILCFLRHLTEDDAFATFRAAEPWFADGRIVGEMPSPDADAVLDRIKGLDRADRR